MHRRSAQRPSDVAMFKKNRQGETALDAVDPAIYETDRSENT